MKNYVADFETTTKPTYLLEGRTRVWGSCIVTVEDEPKVEHIGNNIDDFMEFVISKKNIVVYFHNLKFDGEFIVSWLEHNGYKHSTETPRKEKTYQVLISSMGAWYEIKVYHKVWSKRNVMTTFRDSLKKLPLKVSQVAKAFKLPESKLTIDYDEYRPEGHVLTQQEIDYIINDTVIVAKALNQQFKQGLEKMTVASDSLNFFKNDILHGIGLGEGKFKEMFPVLPLDYDNDVRKSYKGGWCYVHPERQNKRFAGITFDVNSLYPAVMYGKMGALPYGIPRRFEGQYQDDKKYPLYIQKLSCWIELKKGHLPTIQIKNSSRFLETEYITDSKGIIDLVLTNVDLEMMFKHYEVTNIEYYGGYMFKCDSKFFRKYIDFWNNVKVESTLNGNAGLRTIAKLMLNSLYGKFASNPEVKSKYPELDENGIVKLKYSEPEMRDPIYTALASFITAYARRYTITYAQMNYDRFIYADTDSISLVGTDIPSGLPVDDTELGMWKNEGTFDDSVFLRPKTYIKIKGNKTVVTCAGLPQNVKDELEFDTNSIVARHYIDPFDLFKYGASFSGKLVPKRVKGGVILEDTDFTIKVA